MAFRLVSSASIYVLVAVPLISVRPVPLSAQLPDAFAAHFGASRIREPTRKIWSVGLDLMILSQYGSRWKDVTLPAPDTITDYDKLDTTVGYNYLTGGYQDSWLLNLCSCTVVAAASGTFGVTSDNLTETGQDGLHSYMRYPHVRRGHVSKGQFLVGLDVEVALWYSRRWSPISLDLMAGVGGTLGTHHGEQTVGGGIGIGWWLLRFQGWAQKAFWVDRHITPPRVSARMKSDYWMASGLVTLDRTKYKALRDVFPAIGGGVTYSTGLFPQERELLLSVFLEFPGGSNNTWRIEHVNDVLKDKDRGPTGGLRVVYVAR